MTDLLTRLDELRKWLLKERQTLSVMSDPILVRQGMEAVDLHLATVDDACEAIQFASRDHAPPIAAKLDVAVGRAAAELMGSAQWGKPGNVGYMMSVDEETSEVSCRAISEEEFTVSHPIPQSDYKAAQEEIDRRNGLEARVAGAIQSAEEKASRLKLTGETE